MFSMSNKQYIGGFFAEEKEEEDDKEGFHLESSRLTLPALIAMTLI